MSGSELALAIVRFGSEGALTKPRPFHRERRVHLFSNQLSLNEIALCLIQGHGYLRMTAPDDPRATEIMSAIEQIPHAMNRLKPRIGRRAR
jgi:hypothetical protein